MDSLDRLMGGSARLKALRLFFFNATAFYPKDEVARRLRITPRTAGKEIAFLEKSGVIRKKTVITEKETKRGIKKVRVPGWGANANFPFFNILQQFLIDTTLLAKEEIVERLRPTGRIGLLVTSGVFARQWDSRIDLLIVGDRIDHAALEGAIRNMEAQLGRELHFATLTTPEFYYRRSIKDRLIRDVVDFPHEVLIDRIGITNY